MLKGCLILVSTVTDSVSISAFVSLVCTPVGITTSAVGLNKFIGGYKKYKSKEIRIKV